MPTIDAPSTPAPITLTAALDSKRDLLARMPASEILRTPGLDPSVAAGIVIGSLPRIAKHRAAIVAQFGEQGAARVDDLASLAYATEQANVELAAADSSRDLGPMNAELLEEHGLLLGDADALANRKLIERARVDPGRPVLGYRTAVTSTLVLISVFREHWTTIASKTPLTVGDLDRIEMRAQKMLQVVNEREQGSNRLPAVELRARAVSMLFKVYGEVRRMLGYLRYWDDDVDEIAPSLWSGRRSKSRNDVTEPGGNDVTEPAAPLSPNNGGGPFAS